MAILFSERQLRTIRAALLFWHEVAENSRVHPAAHPKVDTYLQERPDLPPLTVAEIKALIENSVVWDASCSTTIGYDLGVVAATPAERIRLRRELRRLGVRPLAKLGSQCTYQIEDLNRAKATLAERDEETFRRRQRALRRSKAGTD